MEQNRAYEARVVAARVYGSGCVTTSACEVELAAGENALLVDCLPAGVAEDSVRVRLPKGVELTSVNVIHEEQGADDEPTKLLRACNDKIARAERRMENRASEKELWKAHAQPVSEGGRPAEDTLRLMQALPEHLDALDDELEQLAAQRRDLLRERDRLQDEQRAAARRRARGLLSLRVAAAQAATVRLEVDARSPHASWSPCYDVLVDDLVGPVRMRMRGEVRQRTGMSWRGIRITLSTGNPSLAGAAPTLTPVRIHRKPPRPSAPAPGFMGMRAMAAAPMMAEETVVLDDAPAEPVFEAAPPQAQASELANTVEFELAGTWNVDSEANDPTLVEIVTTSYDATYECRATPCVDDTVYLVALLGEPLAPEAEGCEASVYLEGEYLGTVALGSADDERPYVLSLGRDTRMHSSRKLVVRRRSDTLLRGRTTNATEYEVSVTSQRKEATHVSLFDQIPISQEKDIVVEATELTGGTLNAETGIVRWEADLAAGESLTARIAYTVTRPKDVEIEEVREVRSAFCPRCGAVVEPGRRFCPTCGTAL